MPRRGGSAPSRSRSPAPPARAAPVPARAAPVAPAPVAPSPAAMAQPRQPGMFAQMATTAAGVAVGSAVGHTLGAAMTGGMGGGSQQQEQPVTVETQPQPVYASQQLPYQQQQLGEGGPCQIQMKQFLECAQTQHDISLCQGFNEALRECKLGYGMSA